MDELENPTWVERGRVNEQQLMMELLREHNLTCHNGRFYGINGYVSDDKVRQQIYKHLRRQYTSGIKEKVESILWALRLELEGNDVHNEPYLIHLLNGTFNTRTWEFSEYKYICQNRLPVRYDPGYVMPQNWMRFVDELLEPEDQITLQQYLGYCLIPSNDAQKMLILLGDGGEGKSRIGVAMSLILGNAMINGSMDKVEHDRFARANLEGKLLMVDDDLNLEALRTTHHIKSIITADTTMDLERKGQQSYQGWLNCRFLCFGNGALRALHDRSNGFYRRQIVLKCKPKDPNRVDDPYLIDKFLEETDSIFMWCLMGLYVLQANNMKIFCSEKTEKAMQHTILEDNNLRGFMTSEGYFYLGPERMDSTRDLYTAYFRWCSDNALKPYSMKLFSSYLSEHQGELGIRYSNNIPLPDGRKVRGFTGISSTLTCN